MGTAVSLRVSHLVRLQTNFRGAKGQLLFVDLADFERSTGQVIDPHKLFESVVVANDFSALRKTLGGQTNSHSKLVKLL